MEFAKPELNNVLLLIKKMRPEAIELIDKQLAKLPEKIVNKISASKRFEYDKNRLELFVGAENSDEEYEVEIVHENDETFLSFSKLNAKDFSNIYDYPIYDNSNDFNMSNSLASLEFINHENNTNIQYNFDLVHLNDGVYLLSEVWTSDDFSDSADKVPFKLLKIEPNDLFNVDESERE